MKMFPGKEVFRLKDETGFPFAKTFEECERNGLMIDWVGLMESAREAGWWDYQTIEIVEEAFSDSGAWPDKRQEIIRRMKAYIVLKPHPGLLVSHLQSV